jgi:hypothetical protein
MVHAMFLIAQFAEDEGTPFSLDLVRELPR